MNDYNFPVELQPIFLPNGKEIQNRKAVVRTDSMTSLGIVSDDYGLVRHETVVDAFRESGKAFNFNESIEMTRNGAYLFYKMTFPKVEIEIRKGDLVRMQMIARNSYNGMNSLQIIFGALRLVCTNGMVIGTKFMQLVYRHVGNVGGMTDITIVDQYQNAIAQYVKLFAERGQTMTEMGRKPMGILLDEAYDQEKVRLPQYVLAKAKDEYVAGSDKTVWGYYNSLTSAITHGLKKPNPELAVNYGTVAWKAAESLLIN